MSWLNGKVGLLTGGASGIGLKTAKEFLTNGIKGLTIADVNAENGETIARELAEEFGSNRILFVKTDVTQSEEVEEAYKKTVATFKNLDIVVNAAGIFSDNLWQKEIAINLNGTINVCLFGLDKYLPSYRSGDDAIIVNISSIAGLRGSESVPVYSATKHAIIGLSRSLGTETHYKRTKVRILTICPGVTETPMMTNFEGRFIGPQYEQIFNDIIAMFPFQKSEEVAKAIVKVIQEGQNGSLWLVNAGKTSEIQLADMYKFLET